MSCNQDNDYLASVSVAGSMVDGYKKSIGADIGVGKYAKLGNILIITQIAGHANHGEWGNVVQDIGVAVATPLIVTALLLASASVLAVTATGIAVSYALNGIIDYIQCHKPEPDPTEPYRPRPDESPTQGYTKQYYDLIILDLDGNGVGTVSKFGVLFMINRGAMFDHNGDGIATQAGWVAVNDEWWERVG